MASVDDVAQKLIDTADATAAKVKEAAEAGGTQALASASNHMSFLKSTLEALNLLNDSQRST